MNIQTPTLILRYQLSVAHWLRPVSNHVRVFDAE